MKFFSLAVTLLVFCTTATADVGLIVINKGNQEQQTANRITVSVGSHPAKNIEILVRPHSGERFASAELEVFDANRLIARIPVRGTPQRESTAQLIDLMLTPQIARGCRLNVLIDSTRSSVGTVFGIDLGSYLTP